MPPVNVKKGKNRKNSDQAVYENEDVDDTPSPEVNQAHCKAMKKRPLRTPDELDFSDAEEDMEKSNDLEMQTMLKTFGADIGKTLSAKRKRIQTFTNASLKASNRKFDEIWKSQQSERHGHRAEFTKQVMSVVGQWEVDLQKTRETEEKLENLYKQQQKVFQQQRIIQSQRLKRVRQLHEEYTKKSQDLDKIHIQQHMNVQDHLRKEISMLQKKILTDTQQQDFSSVRRSLQNMLAQV